MMRGYNNSINDCSRPVFPAMPWKTAWHSYGIVTFCHTLENTMATETKICLLGFSASELSALHALVRLMMRRGQVCTLVHKPIEADVVVANADDPATMRLLWASSAVSRVLLVGENDGATGWPLLSRPMKLLTILDAVDALLAAPPVQRGGAAAESTSGFAMTRPYAAGDSRHGGLDSKASGFPATQPFVGLDALPATPRVPMPAIVPGAAIDANAIEQWRVAQRMRQDPATVATQLLPLPDMSEGDLATVPPPLTPRPAPRPALTPTAPEAAESAPHSQPSLPAMTAPLGDALVVGDGDLSRRTFQKRLHGKGLRSDAVRTGEEVLRQAARRPYRFVFLDTPAGDMSALQIARALRKFKPDSGQRPRVILLMNRDSLLTRLRARLAGCAACLVKPVDEKALTRLVGAGLH